MTQAPKRECNGPGCHVLVTPPMSRCAKCKKVKQKSAKPSKVRKWLNSARYKKMRARQLRNEPLCRECGKNGIVKAAVIYDHIIPHKENYELFWYGEAQSLCIKCHNIKTSTEDGGFGH